MATRRQKAALKRARAAKAAKRAQSNGSSGSVHESLREYAVMFRSADSQDHLEEVTPLRFHTSVDAVAFAGLLRTRFPQYEYFVTT
jgi:hypothetical protein